VIDAIGEADPLDHLKADLLALPARHAAVKQRNLDILQNIQMRNQIE